MKILVTGGSGFIGTNLIDKLLSEGSEILNIDTAYPKVESMTAFWKKCDILNYEQVREAFISFRPEAVVHLAAQTDTDPSKTIADYKVNIEGSDNIINIIKEVGFVKRIVFTSTQFVNQSEHGPRHDQDYAPHTVYGESKIISEQHLRESQIDAIWTIIRPTNIWGPWHLRYPFEFWKILSDGKYFHPGHQKVIRSYGYVGNVVDQIRAILEKPKDLVHQKVYYVGDRPIDLYDWVNGFNLRQTGKKVIVMPRFFVFSLAILGNALRLVGIKFPITLSRYRSMTTSNPAYMEKTFQELGEPGYTLDQGIEETVRWLRTTHPDLVKIK